MFCAGNVVCVGMKKTKVARAAAPNHYSSAVKIKN